jgi:thiamine-phosphate pyrophosphorylase
MLPNPPVMVITDRTQCRDDLESRAIALFKGGCRWMSLREKDLAPDVRLRLLERLKAIGADFGATVGVHGDIAAAAHCGAALHLPAGADAAKARASLGDTILLGQSCHSIADIKAAAGVDYVTLSPVFGSASKPGYGPALGPAGLASAAGASRTPILALGGVTLSTLPLLKGTGISGVAIMGAAMTAPDPEDWIRSVILLLRP